MSTQIRHFFEALPPAELDRYLSAGWRPAGQGIYTADFLRADDEEIYGCVQVRLPLEGFRFKPRHRKILRKNNASFRIEYGVAGDPDEELRALNRRYMAVHAEKSREDLDLHVTGEYLVKVLDTRIIRVYDEDKLVAFSYFDLGEETAYTKAGIYDPEYSTFSLGIYTMLLEIAWLQQRGVRYYHPGYVSPRYPAFDYKLQFGPMEFRQVHTGNWVPLAREQPEDLYIMAEQALLRVAAALSTTKIRAELVDYPSFTARYHYQSPLLNLLDSPLLLALSAGAAGWTGLMVIFDVESQQYQLLRTRKTSLQDVNIKQFSNSGRRRFPYPVCIDQVLFETSAVSELTGKINQLAEASGI